MCYSAQLKADYRQFLRDTGTRIDIDSFMRLYWERSEGAKHRIPRAMDALFAAPATADERRIADLVAAFDRAEAARLEQLLFGQRKRLADAERKLQQKHTKAAAESRRIATNKVQWALGKLAALRRTALSPDDARIFPGMQDMLVACLWSRWEPPAGSGSDPLLSFAAITDEPPPEVAAAGHDRCIIPVKPAHLDAWLRPSGDLAESYAILDDRARPYYEHRMAA